MKLLYAIQGTGNGHLSRATEIIPLLRKRCETDLLVSGNQTEIQLPYKPAYRLNGLTFYYDKKGGIDYAKTYKKSNIRSFMSEINELPVEEYDLVINDFEPVSAWASYRRNVPCVALSHQAALLNSNVPKPGKKDAIGQFVLKNYAPASCYFGFHFSRYSKNIYTPVIRKEIREASKSDTGRYVVYLPAYDDQILVYVLSNLPEAEWIIFSTRAKHLNTINGITVTPIDPIMFSKSLAECTGVLCSAGFETPAEALYLGKKLMVVPIKRQYEQQYNAAALKNMGIPVLKKLDESGIAKIQEWIKSDYKIEITYPDQTDQIIKQIFEWFVEGNLKQKKWSENFKMAPAKKLLS